MAGADAGARRAFYATPAAAHHARCAVRTLGWQLRERQRLGEVKALRVIDADAPELIEHRLALDALGDGGDAERAADLADGLDHAAVDRIGGDVIDELAVDLEKIDRQRLQVHERRHPGAEIIEREAAAAAL